MCFEREVIFKEEGLYTLMFYFDASG